MIGATLSHYEILEKLGSGGMGDVYLADDTKLKRRVAIKVLPDEMAQDAERLERFQREAEAVAALDHPNVVTIHAVEEVDGTHFLVMALVEGRPLSEMIPPGGMTTSRLFDIAIPVAAALAAAHERGVVHRDLKPGNVMAGSDGRVTVLDFGLAKLLESGPAGAQTMAATEPLTEAGRIVGTVPYMSPEQLQGAAVDHRTDVYSFGVLLYEMATGAKPFQGASKVELISAILRDTPSSVTDVKRELPVHLGRIVRRCLEKDPSRRFQSMLDVRNDLDDLRKEMASGITESAAAMPAASAAARPRWWTAAIGVAVVATVAFLATRIGDGGVGQPSTAVTETPAASAEAPAEVATPTMMVSQFENLGNADDEFFASGMTEEITVQLAPVAGLSVLSRKTALRYAESDKTAREIGEELGIDYLLEGTVRWARGGEGSSRVRISPQLVRTADETTMWADVYDREIDDIFQVQAEIAESVVEALGVALLEGAGSTVTERPTSNLEAYQAYLRANDLQGSPSANDDTSLQVLDLYHRAVELDPRFVSAWGRIAHHASYLYYNGNEPGDLSQADLLAMAREARDRAVELDPDHPWARLAVGYLLYYEKGDFDGALAAFRAVAQSRPNDVEVLSAIAWVLRRLGRFEDAVLQIRRALEVAPGDYGLGRASVQTLQAMRRFDEAGRELQSLAARYQNCDLFGFQAHHLARYEGDVEGALRVLEPCTGDSASRHFEILLFAGRLDEARALLTDEDPWTALSLAEVDTLLGHELDGPRLERALTELQPFEGGSWDTRAGTQVGRGFALTLLGRADEGIREVETALAEHSRMRDRWTGPNLEHFAAVVLAWAGERETAIDMVERLLIVEGYAPLTRTILRLDPRWDPLRDHPRFAALVEGDGL